jgi:hypothetical protein
MYLTIPDLPVIHGERVPARCFMSPFVKPPADVDAQFQSYETLRLQREACQELPNGPADNGYCEICQTSFQSAAAHHESEEHLRKTKNTETFALLDGFITERSALFSELLKS